MNLFQNKIIFKQQKNIAIFEKKYSIMNYKLFSTAVFSIAFLFIFNSCNVEPVDPILASQVSNSSSSSESNDITTSIYKWSFKLDGVLYEWQGNHILNSNSGGQSTYSINSIALQETNSSNLPVITVSMIFPSTSTGNFIFNQVACHLRRKP
jgi:hypothetical protein